MTYSKSHSPLSPTTPTSAKWQATASTKCQAPASATCQAPTSAKRPTTKWNNDFGMTLFVVRSLFSFLPTNKRGSAICPTKSFLGPPSGTKSCGPCPKPCGPFPKSRAPFPKSLNQHLFELMRTCQENWWKFPKVKRTFITCIKILARFYVKWKHLHY